MSFFHRPKADALKEANESLESKRDWLFGNSLFMHIRKDQCLRCAQAMLELPAWQKWTLELRKIAGFCVTLDEYARTIEYDYRKQVSAFFQNRSELVSNPERAIAVGADDVWHAILSQRIRPIREVFDWFETYAWLLLGIARLINLKGIFATEFLSASGDWLLREVARQGDFPDCCGSTKSSMPAFIEQFRAAIVREYNSAIYILNCELAEMPGELEPPDSRFVDLAFPLVWAASNVWFAIKSDQREAHPEAYEVFSRHVLHSEDIRVVAETMNMSIVDAYCNAMWMIECAVDAYHECQLEDSLRPVTLTSVEWEQIFEMLEQPKQRFRNDAREN